MYADYWGRAARFWTNDPHRWATCEEIPPDDRESHYRFAARVARHAEAQDLARAESAYRDRWGHERWNTPAAD